MRLIGLTGGIGTGKSSVAGFLRELGVTVIDADEATRAVQAPGTEGLRLLADAFGEEILTPEGALDRPRLAAIAFADPKARQRLNEIVHPLVRWWMAERQREAAARGDPVVVLDVPLSPPLSVTVSMKPSTCCDATCGAVKDSDALPAPDNGAALAPLVWVQA